MRTGSGRKMKRALVMIPALMVGAVPGPASAKEPVRSGQILAGIYSTGPWGCELTPDCEIWRDSGCDPMMRGMQEPAFFTSIVDVEDLASRRTVRRFKAVPRDSMPYYGGAVIEFWGPDCRRVQPAESPHWVKAPAGRQIKLTIPARARWMTVVSSDCVRIDWALT